MSRNLCTSSCPNCGYTLSLSDLRGKPVEFRRYGPYAPEIGCRFDCSCGEVYFAIWRRKDNYWERETLLSGAWKNPTLTLPDGRTIPNPEAGRFAVERPIPWDKDSVWPEETGTFTIDLSYYETYDDEKSYSLHEQEVRDGKKPPAHLCVDDAKDVQVIWGPK